MWGKQPLKERCFFRICLPSKIFRTLQGDDSGFVIFRRGWVSEKQCSVSEDCFLLVHCQRKITRLPDSRSAPVTFVGNIKRNPHKNTDYACLTNRHFVLQFVKQKYLFISAVLQTVQHCLTHCETKIKIFLQSRQISKGFFRQNVLNVLLGIFQTDTRFRFAIPFSHTHLKNTGEIVIIGFAIFFAYTSRNFSIINCTNHCLCYHSHQSFVMFHQFIQKHFALFFCQFFQITPHLLSVLLLQLQFAFLPVVMLKSCFHIGTGTSINVILPAPAS